MSRDVPTIAEKTTDRPSGEKAGERGMSGATGIRSTMPPPRAEKMKSWRPRSWRAKTAIRSPSGAKERSRPLSGPWVRNWADDVLVLRRPSGREVLPELPRLRREEGDVDVVLVRRQRRDEVARGGRRRADLERGALPAPDAEPLAVLGGLSLDGEEREVLPAEVPAELQVEVVGLDLERPLEGHGDVPAEERAELEDELANGVLAPLGLDEVEEGVAEAVGGVAVDVDARDRAGSGRSSPRRG